jgi:protein phosphatase
MEIVFRENPAPQNADETKMRPMGEGREAANDISSYISKGYEIQSCWYSNCVEKSRYSTDTLRLCRDATRPDTRIKPPSERDTTGGISIKVRFFAKSDIGKKRLINQDSYYCDPDVGFCILADGMGGHRSGEVASRMAVEILSTYIAKSGSSILDRLARGRDRQLRSMITDLLEEWTQNTNMAIYQEGSGVADRSRKMGTTLALIYFLGKFAAIAHIGDSRIYRLRGKILRRLTKDHSIVAEESRMTNVPTAGAKRKGKKRKYITRALGTKPEVRPEIRLTDVEEGDLFILCSDGLTDLVKDYEIRRILLNSEGDLYIALHDLIDLANTKGGSDNITVILGEVEEEDAEDTETIAYAVDDDPIAD